MAAPAAAILTKTVGGTSSPRQREADPIGRALGAVDDVDPLDGAADDPTERHGVETRHVDAGWSDRRVTRS